MSLPKLDSVKQCAKCLAEEDSRGTSRLLAVRQFGYRYNAEGEDFQDSIKRRCWRCGYEWLEQCADFEEVSESETQRRCTYMVSWEGCVEPQQCKLKEYHSGFCEVDVEEQV